MIKKWYIWLLIVLLAGGIGVWFFAPVTPLRVTISSFEFHNQAGNDWLRVVWKIYNPSSSYAEDIIVETAHFDGGSWLSPIKSSSGYTIAGGDFTEFVTTMATRVAPKCYLGIGTMTINETPTSYNMCQAQEPPMYLQVKVRWTAAGYFRREVVRGFALRAEGHREGI
ncbi:hypothetical protein LCGC14_0393980 [marine sediment metagenome]|uniref:Uncharacterized protein n=1 Tax=marine sediment metagenome TaxID=412755 RepID=A0A0F9W7N2_9ZZZZ